MAIKNKVFLTIVACAVTAPAYGTPSSFVRFFARNVTAAINNNLQKKNFRDFSKTSARYPFTDKRQQQQQNGSPSFYEKPRTESYYMARLSHYTFAAVIAGVPQKNFQSFYRNYLKR